MSSSNDKLFVAKLPNGTKDADIEDAFRKFGAISNIETKLGYAFVTFADPNSAADAVAASDTAVLGVNVDVQWSRSREPKAQKSRDNFRIAIENLDRFTRWEVILFHVISHYK